MDHSGFGFSLDSSSYFRLGAGSSCCSSSDPTSSDPRGLQPALKKTCLERWLERTQSRNTRKWDICRTDTISQVQPLIPWSASQTIWSRKWDQVCDTVQALTALEMVPEPLPMSPLSPVTQPMETCMVTWEVVRRPERVYLFQHPSKFEQTRPELKKHQKLPFQPSTVGKLCPGDNI